MTAWTKKDIGSLCGMLDSWWLVNRPLDYRRVAELAEKGREMLSNATARKEIVLAGIRAARATASERYRQNCQTVGNQLVRFTEYGKPDELVDRFIGFAREEDEAEKRLEKLLRRVLDDGLPYEVLAYDPIPARSE